MASSSETLTQRASSENVRAGRGAAPLWRAEKFFLTLGKAPAAVGRGLDVLARMPGLKWVMRPLSSVWVGIATLFLIGVYIGIGSGFASWRAKWEMTDLEFFNAWPMRVLVGLLAVNLSVVTLRRIPLTLYKLGVWTVHVGILTLLTGSVMYFSQKNEGSVRIYLNKTVGEYYDATERALYAYSIKADGTADRERESMTPLPGLPIYFEHLRERGNGLDRVLPKEAAGGADVALKIMGYYPYAVMESDWGMNPDPKAEPINPAVLINLGSTINFGAQWFIGKSPAGRVFDGPRIPFAVEYVYHPTAEQMADMTAEFTGAQGITVRVPKAKVAKTYSVVEGKPIAVEGTAYTLVPGDETAMPLVSKGYENALSNTLTVKVTRKDGEKETTFDRMVLSRYPERSPDFVVVDGKPKRIQDRVDHDIELTFHEGRKDQVWVVEGADGKLEVIHRKAGGGKVERLPVTRNETVEMAVLGVPLKLTLLEQTPAAIEVPAARIVPEQQRQRGQTAMDAMQFSIIELEVSSGSFKQTRFVPFVQFAQIGEPPVGRPLTVVDVPGAGKIGFLLSTTRRPLPVNVTLKDFKPIKYAGAMNTYEDYVSTLMFTDKAGGQGETMVARLNEPAMDRGLSYFQSAWDGDDHAMAEKRFSVLGVGNRPGLMTMTVGSILMLAGIGYAFYVKPILLKRKKEWLAAWARDDARS